MSSLLYSFGIMLNSLYDKLLLVSQTPDNVLTMAIMSTKYAANLSFSIWKLLGSTGLFQYVRISCMRLLFAVVFLVPSQTPDNVLTMATCLLNMPQICPLVSGSYFDQQAYCSM